MTTKKYLSQIDRLNTMIESKLDEIARLRTLATSVSIHTDKERVQSSGTPDKLGETVAKIYDLEVETDALVDKFIDQRQRIIEQIDGLDNTTYYKILTHTYVKCEKHYDVAYKLGYSERTFYRVMNEALDYFEKRYGSEYLKK